MKQVGKCDCGDDLPKTPSQGKYRNRCDNCERKLLLARKRAMRAKSKVRTVTKSELKASVRGQRP